MSEPLRQRPEVHAAVRVAMAIEFVSIINAGEERLALHAESTRGNSRQPGTPKISCELCRITAAIGTPSTRKLPTSHSSSEEQQSAETIQDRGCNSIRLTGS